MLNNAEEAQGFLNAASFSAWIDRHKLQVTQVARMFDVTPSTVWRWRKVGAPKLVYWACKAYDSGVRPAWLSDDLKPPMKKNDRRRGNTPPHVRAAMQAAEAAKPQRRPRAPEWPVDTIYDD